MTSRARIISWSDGVGDCCHPGTDGGRVHGHHCMHHVVLLRGGREDKEGVEEREMGGTSLSTTVFI